MTISDPDADDLYAQQLWEKKQAKRRAWEEKEFPHGDDNGINTEQD